jgi:hypothetical protein
MSAHGGVKAVSYACVYFKRSLSLKDFDAANIILGYMAQATNQRDQPFGISVGVAAHRETEPWRV